MVVFRGEVVSEERAFIELTGLIQSTGSDRRLRRDAGFVP